MPILLYFVISLTNVLSASSLWLFIHHFKLGSCELSSTPRVFEILMVGATV